MTLSELVAVEVMGDKPEVSQQVSNDGGKSTAFGNDDWSTQHIDMHAWLAEKQASGIMLDYKVVEWKRYPRYDTNIADAWRVVEKMKHRQPMVCASVNDGWMCGMLASDDPNDTEDVYEDEDFLVCRRRISEHTTTAPLAICLAALRACGVSEARIEQARRKA